jgi:hypothetical protein
MKFSSIFFTLDLKPLLSKSLKFKQMSEHFIMVNLEVFFKLIKKLEELLIKKTFLYLRMMKSLVIKRTHQMEVTFLV